MFRLPFVGKAMSAVALLVLQTGCLSPEIIVPPNQNVVLHNGNAKALLWAGATTSLLAGNCQSYTVTAVDNDGVVAAVTGDVTLSLSGASAGAFYAGSSCVGSAISSVNLPTGQNSISISFQDNTADSPTFVVAGAGLSSGSAAINVSFSSYAYNPAVNLSDDTQTDIYVCGVGASGGLSSCATSDGGVDNTSWYPIGMAVHTTAGNTYAYVADGFGNLYQCPVLGSGLLDTCTATNLEAWYPYGITFRSFGGTTYAYVADVSANVGAGLIWQCPVDTLSGVLTSCVLALDPSQTPSWTPNASVVFSSFGGKIYAYIVDYGLGWDGVNGDPQAPGNVYKCSVDNTSGLFTSCVVSNGGVTALWVPYQISFNAFGGNNYAYIADNGNDDNVYVCPIDDVTGDLTNCVTSNPAAQDGNWYPEGITLASFNGVTSAFVGDGGGNVYQCSLDSGTGQLVSCNANNGGSPDETGIWSPNGGVVFH
jgi:hypothetical protein